MSPSARQSPMLLPPPAEPSPDPALGLSVLAAPEEEVWCPGARDEKAASLGLPARASGR